MAVINPFDFFVEPFAEHFPFAYPAELAEELAPYLVAEPPGPLLTAFLAALPRERQNIVDFLVELNQRLQREIRYLDPHGAGRADAGGDAGVGRRLVPRQRLAARCRSCGISVSRRGSCPAISSS